MEVPTVTVAQIVESAQLQEERALQLKEYFEPFEKQAQEWKEKATGILVQDHTDKPGMKAAKEARLSLRSVRLAVEKKHKELKADAIREGRMYDQIKGTLLSYIEPIEEILLQKEKTAERYEQEVELAKEIQLQALRRERIKTLKPYTTTTDNIEVIALEEMTQDAFDNFLSAYQAKHEKSEADRKELAKLREANERMAREEQERVEAQQKKNTEDKVRIEKLWRSRLAELSDIGHVGWNAQEAFCKADGDSVIINYDDLISISDATFKMVKDSYQVKVDAINKHLAAEQERKDKISARVKQLTENGMVFDFKENTYRKEIDLPDDYYTVFFMPPMDIQTYSDEKFADFISKLKEKSELAATHKKAKEAELKRLQDEESERKEKSEKEEKARKKALRAPDKEKLKAWIDSIMDVPFPALKSHEAKQVYEKAFGMLIDVKKMVDDEIKLM